MVMFSTERSVVVFYYVLDLRLIHCFMFLCVYCPYVSVCYTLCVFYK